MTVDPGDWPTPDGDNNGEPPPVPWPGEPDLPTWMHQVALMRIGAL